MNAGIRNTESFWALFLMRNNFIKAKKKAGYLQVNTVKIQTLTIGEKHLEEAE